MWFGTRDGLNKYDGYKFTVYRHNPADSGSLSDNAISCLFEDSRGNIWAGTHRGSLNMFNRSTNTFSHYYPGSKLSQENALGEIAVICEDLKGYLWFTSSPPNTGLRKLDPRTGQVYHYIHDPSDPHSISSNDATYVCRDSMGVIWMGTFNCGINRYNEKDDNFTNYRTQPEYGLKVTGKIQQLHAYQNQSFWIGDWSAYISLLVLSKNQAHRNRFTSTYMPLREGEERITSLLQDRSGQIWIARLGGIYFLNKTNGLITPITLTLAGSSDIAANNVSNLYQDHNNNIWICTVSGVLKIHFQSRYFQHFQLPSPNFQAVNVRSIFKQDNNTLWIGSEGNGLYKINPLSISILHATSPYQSKFRINTINTIYQDSEKKIWCGTNAGFLLVDSVNNKLHTFLPSQSQREMRIWSIIEPLPDMLWCGPLRRGLQKIDIKNRKATHYSYLDNRVFTDKYGGVGKNSLYQQEYDINLGVESRTNNSIFSLLRDSKGQIWVGTNRGLYKVAPSQKTVVHYKHTDNDSSSVSPYDIWYIHESHDGTIWLGTSGGGLNALNPRTGTFAHFTENQGLPSNIICGILEDEHHNLWISTNKGLARFNTRSKSITSFGIGDGLFISEFHFKACFKDTDGTMYFGGIGGYVRFHPDSITANSKAPMMAFTSFKVFDKELLLDTAITYKREIQLNHTNNYFSVEFTALDFSNPLKNNYRYRLIGFDEQWRETDGSRPYASYTNIPPGEYVLWVQGSNSDGVWNSAGISLFIVISPAWWQTWWFRTAVILSLMIIVASLAWWRYRSLKRRNEVERRLVESQLQALRSQMNPHFIFNSLNSILHFITTNDPETAHVYLSKFSKLIRAILENSRSEFISLEEEVRVLGLYLELEALRFDNQFSYEIIIDLDIDLQAQQIPPMLLQPHVENAIKHGLIHTVPDGRLEVRIRRQGDIIICSVTDNGIGRERAQALKQRSLYKHVSQGIALTKDRIAILNSIHSEHYGVEINDLTDDSGISAGTRVDIRVSSGPPGTK